MPAPESSPHPLSPQRYEAIHRALLAGLLSNVGVKSENHEFSGARNVKFHIHPSSALFKANPQWIMAGEIVETTKLYARNVARIQPLWIERAAEHVVKREYSEPHWQASSGHVLAFERVSLYGLVIVPRRSVHFGPIAPTAAREMFIHHALVEMDYRSTAPFFLHNQKLRDRVLLMQAKARRNDLLSDPAGRHAIFHALVPPDITNWPLFDRWRKEAEVAAPQLLYLVLEKTVRAGALWPDETLYPDALTAGGMTFDLRYTFDPASDADGVTALIPLAALNQLRAEMFDWLIPGHRRELILELIRALPKASRVLLVPAPDHADAVASALGIATPGPMRETIAWHLGQRAGTAIRPADLDLAALPKYLRINYAVIDAHGKILSASRDLTELQESFGARARETFAAASRHAGEFQRDNIKSWDFGDLPPTVEVSRGGMTLLGYPALIEIGETVALRLFDSTDAADRAMHGGVRRLLMMQMGKEIDYLRRNLPHIEQMQLYYAPLGDGAALKEQLVTAIIEHALFPNDEPIRTRRAFEDRAASAWKRLAAATREVTDAVHASLEIYQRLQLSLAGAQAPLLLPSVRDMREQVGRLVYKGWVAGVPWEYLQYIPRYLAGVEIRLRKLKNAGLSRDTSAMLQLEPHENRLRSTRENPPAIPAARIALERYRWLMEELRISLFAQELKTPEPISPQRLEAVWREVRR